MTKNITYDHGDYRMELDGRYVGHRSTYHQAETALDEMIYEALTHGDTMTAEQLDGGSFCATCGNDGDCPDCQPECPYCAHGAVPCPICDQPLLDDIAAVLDAALGNAPAKDIVPELRRVRQRIATTLV